MSAVHAGGGVRASDVERERVAQVLQRAAADGRLSPEEAGERLAAASAARFREELARLMIDLPGGGAGALMPEPALPGRRVGAGVLVALGLARVAVTMALFAGVWFLWGVGFFWMFWPLAFVLFGGLFGWRRRLWRYRMAGRWW